MELVLMNHLKELKWRFIYLGFAFILTFLISYYYVNELLFLIMNPFQNHIPLFIYTNLIDGLSSTLKIDLIWTILINIPLWLYHLWTFLSPGWYQWEKRKYLKFLIFWLFSFYLIIYLISTTILPHLWNFFLSFQIQGNLSIHFQGRINNYLDSLMSTYFTLLFIFQFPIYLMIIISLNILKIETFLKFRVFIYFLIFLFGVFITPPDLFSLILIMIPSLLFYEILWFIFLFQNYAWKDLNFQPSDS